MTAFLCSLLPYAAFHCFYYHFIAYMRWQFVVNPVHSRSNVGAPTWGARYALRVSRGVIVNLSLKVRQRHLSPSDERTTKKAAVIAAAFFYV